MDSGKVWTDNDVQMRGLVWQSMQEREREREREKGMHERLLKSSESESSFRSPK